jgi:hypothetical protein
MKRSMAGSLRRRVIVRRLPSGFGHQRVTAGLCEPAADGASSVGPVALRPYLIGTNAGAL